MLTAGAAGVPTSRLGARGYRTRHQTGGGGSWKAAQRKGLAAAAQRAAPLSPEVMHKNATEGKSEDDRGKGGH